MPLSPESRQLRRLVVIAMLASLAVVLGFLEAMIPFAVTIPGAKLGLGNILVLTCLVLFGGKDAFTLVAVKTLLTAFLIGSFSTLLFSLAGALASLMIMYGLLAFGRNQFSLMGISVAGGVAHNAGQLAVASLVLGTTKIYAYLPFLMLSGIVTGIFVGLSARYLIASLSRIDRFRALMKEREEGAR